MLERGPYKHREEQYRQARKYRQDEWTIRAISEELDIPLKTVHGWIEDIDVDLSGQHPGGQRKSFENLKHKPTIKSRLIDERGPCCENCNNDSWQGKDIPLEIHRIITGKPYGECTREELEILCPNCHALTDDYRGAAKSRSEGN